MNPASDMRKAMGALAIEREEVVMWSIVVSTKS